MSRLARLIAVPVALAAPFLAIGTAVAEEPTDLTRELTDTAGVLGEHRAAPLLVRD